MIKNVPTHIANQRLDKAASELFDEFSDAEKLGEGVKNLAFHLSFQSSEKTLDESKIEADFQNIVQTLSQKHKAELRA